MSQDKVLPPWASEKIEQLKQVEILLGNLPKGDSHLSGKVSQFIENLKKDQPISDETAEFLFVKIVRGLRAEGFSDEEIAKAVNATVFYKDGPKYCDASEVGEV